jgi:GAF domain-containing protein
VRFYAGYPIEAPDGVCVGTLCVFDPEPREFGDADAALLRGLALMAQSELHRSAAR